jgi:predicted RNA-binding protein YlxR (DUF448 family)/ribosomal protein L7Ae-like RNA K-turn-binding protein
MKAAAKENNVRTCTACGEKGDKGTLLRFAAAGGLIIPDWRGTLGGRAIYSCLTPACVSRFYTQKRLPEKFFKGTPAFAVPQGEIHGWIKSQAEASLIHFLGLARKSGGMTPGQNTLADAIERGDEPPAAVLLAADLAERTIREMTGIIPQTVTLLRWGTKESIGAATGMRPVGVIALSASPITERIKHYCAVINHFSQEL